MTLTELESTASTHLSDRRNRASLLNKYVEALKSDGFVLFNVAQFGENHRTVVAMFGTIVPQYDGEESYAVTYRSGFDEFLYSKSLNPIGPHTEAPLFDPPPRLLALYCKHQAQCGGGATLLADARAFLLQRPDVEVELCRTWPIKFTGSPNPGQVETLTTESFILTSGPDGPIVRFSHNFFAFGDTNARLSNRRDLAELGYPKALDSAINATFRFFDDRALPIVIPEGYMLVWDNHRMLHGRTAFSDLSRHLTRYWLA